jgi:hypothetical protein
MNQWSVRRVKIVFLFVLSEDLTKYIGLSFYCLDCSKINEWIELM